KGCGRLNPARWTQLESWLRVRSNGKIVDQDRWLELLAAVPDEPGPRSLPANAEASAAAAFLLGIAADASPFVQRRLRDVADLVKQPTRLGFFVSRAETRVADTVERIYLMRHR